MADSGKDKFKYTLLKGIDFSGFTVFDPVVRLFFGEDPKKQLSDIGRYMITPIIFIIGCIIIWSVMAPRHKTKSGEVPGPDRVLASYENNKRFHERENEKQSDFNATGAERETILANVQEQIKTYTALADEKAKEAALAAVEVQDTIDAKILPLQSKLDSIKEKSKEAQKLRRANISTLAEGVAANTAESSALITAIAEDKALKEKERESTKELKAQIDEIRANPPKRLKEAQLASNKVADELQHLKKRVDFLTTGNRSEKVSSSLESASEATAAIPLATTGPEVLKSAKAAVRNAESAERAKEQKYPRAATVFWQAYRSIFTVIIGFFMACAVAIPVGMMCGLNRVFMACMTPIISIFRPVSPVVWLLIFQIIIGAFFPNPDEHPLFKFFNASWNPLEFLQVNPAMVFSAFTVAICAMWPALVNTALGVSSVDRDHMNVAKVLRLGFWSRLFKIIIPSSLPLMFAGLRISLGVGWMVLIAAEALSSSDGLGKFVWDEYQNGSSLSFANIILACFIVGIIGFFLDRIMIVLQKIVTFDDGSATV